MEYAHNSLTSAATGLSPFECSLGYQPPLFPELERDLDVPSVQHHLQKIQQTWVTVREALLRTADVNRRQADRHRSPAPQYTRGQEVWLNTRDVPLRASTGKLSPRFIGPFKIQAVLSTTAVRLDLPPSLRIHPTFHISQIKPVSTSVLCPPAQPPPPPRLVDNSLAYTLHRILDVRRRGRGQQYLVDWEGYGPEERFWVPRSHILDPSLISDFLRSRQGESSGLPGGSR